MSNAIPPRCRIIAECASNHGGDWATIERMIQAAAEADFVKFQAYRTVNLAQTDPQYAWLNAAQLNLSQIEEIVRLVGPRALFTVFDTQRVGELRWAGVKAFKVGHADRWRQLWEGAPSDEEWFVSYAWGRGCIDSFGWPLATIPLYPAPLEALVGMTQLTGYSDHTIGLDACKIMMARGVQVVEKHFSIEGCPRRQPWDMDEKGLAELVAWSKVCAEAQQGTALTERWGA